MPSPLIPEATLYFEYKDAVWKEWAKSYDWKGVQHRSTGFTATEVRAG